MLKNLLIIVALTGLIFAYLYNPFRSVSKSPIVQTSFGKVVGSISSSRTGKEYYEYLGIPYALPPVGKNRFEVTLVVFYQWTIFLFLSLLLSHQIFRLHGKGLRKQLHMDQNVCNWKCWQTNWAAAKTVYFSTYLYPRYKVRLRHLCFSRQPFLSLLIKSLSINKKAQQVTQLRFLKLLSFLYLSRYNKKIVVFIILSSQPLLIYCIAL